ncbi:hydantoinase/oxoprolinase family protein [Bosea thiooxidans]|nr:hydantoinase/oxoprolinase family protein [Bosea sp. (in: a-proteobacteria)]
MFRIGVDIGGTFTDFAIWRGEGEGYVRIGSHKRPTSRPDLAQAVREGLDEIARHHRLTPDSPFLVIHGTTISTNAVIERSQPPVALITTAGFRDVLGIARLRLDKPVDLFNRRPEPLVPRERVFTVRERLLADGTVDTPLDEEGLVQALRAARDSGATAAAICFLHAHRNPAHEERALALAGAHLPDFPVMASHQVWAQQGEYERATLTLLNIYVRGLMDGYLGEIERFLAECYPQARLFITKSNGGIMSAAEARRLPIHTLLSGPAAGVTAARELGGHLGLDRLLTFDMGGTSVDVSLVDAGREAVSAQAEIGDFPLLLPVTAVEAMGAGGGSLIWLDGGILKVGPRSAGSDPGPACYARGGTTPTLTDAYLIAGYLSPEGLLGGELPLRTDLAEAAFAPAAEALGIPVVAVAEAAIEVATSTMMARIIPFLARQGVEASDLAMMLYGGAGGIHGPIVAAEAGMQRIVVPRLPSVFCALGGIVSDFVYDAIRVTHGVVPEPAAFDALVVELAAEGREWLTRQGLSEQITGLARIDIADMRYAAQAFTLPVDISLCGIAGAADAFRREHERLFGHSDAEAAIAIDSLRVRMIGRQDKPHAGGSGATSPGRDAVSRRRIYVGGAWHEAASVLSWNDLDPAVAVSGPAIIERDIATILVPPGFSARIGAMGDLDIVRKD